MKQASLDLICIGRSSVDLYGQQVGGRLEDMGSFAKYVGGSPSNTAIGTARLGLKSLPVPSLSEGFELLVWVCRSIDLAERQTHDHDCHE